MHFLHRNCTAISAMVEGFCFKGRVAKKNIGIQEKYFCAAVHFPSLKISSTTNFLLLN